MGSLVETPTGRVWGQNSTDRLNERVDGLTDFTSMESRSLAPKTEAKVPRTVTQCKGETQREVRRDMRTSHSHKQ